MAVTPDSPMHSTQALAPGSKTKRTMVGSSPLIFTLFFDMLNLPLFSQSSHGVMNAPFSHGGKPSVFFLHNVPVASRNQREHGDHVRLHPFTPLKKKRCIKYSWSHRPPPPCFLHLWVSKAVCPTFSIAFVSDLVEHTRPCFRFSLLTFITGNITPPSFYYHQIAWKRPPGGPTVLGMAYTSRVGRGTFIPDLHLPRPGSSCRSSAPQKPTTTSHVAAGSGPSLPTTVSSGDASKRIKLLFT